MKTKTNWKNVTITLLAATNLMYMIDNTRQSYTIEELRTNEPTNERINELEDELSYWINEALALEWDIADLKDELVTLDEEAANYYLLYKDTLNELYNVQIDAGLYIEDL